MSDEFPPIECCPSCECKDALSYEIIPESILEFTSVHEDDGVVNNRHYMPVMHDYRCRNCDTKFLIMPEGTR